MARGRKRVELQGEHLKLYTELSKQAKKANTRLTTIYREYGSDTWASKKLRERLESTKVDGLTVQGKIKVNKSMSITQLRKIQKATDQFLASKTSTIRGIRATQKSITEGLQKALSDSTIQLSNIDANDMYQMLENKNNFLPFVDKLGASTMWSLIDDAKTKGINKYKANASIDDIVADAKKYNLVPKGISADEVEELIYTNKSAFIERLNDIHKDEWIDMLNMYTGSMSDIYKKKAERLFNKYLTKK